jgi:hypothetical protein
MNTRGGIGNAPLFVLIKISSEEEFFFINLPLGLFRTCKRNRQHQMKPPNSGEKEKPKQQAHQSRPPQIL